MAANCFDQTEALNYFLSRIQIIDDFSPYLNSLEGKPIKLNKNRSKEFNGGSNLETKEEVFELPLFSSRITYEGPNDGVSEQDTPRGDLSVNAGGPVLAMDWCRCIHTENKNQYQEIALSANPSANKKNEIGKVVSGKNGIQIWSLNLDFDFNPHVDFPSDPQQPLVDFPFHPYPPQTQPGTEPITKKKGKNQKRRKTKEAESSQPRLNTIHQNDPSDRRKLDIRKSRSMSTPMFMSTSDHDLSNTYGNERDKELEVEEIEESNQCVETFDPSNYQNVQSFSTNAINISFFLAHESGFSRDLKWKPETENENLVENESRRENEEKNKNGNANEHENKNNLENEKGDTMKDRNASNAFVSSSNSPSLPSMESKLEDIRKGKMNEMNDLRLGILASAFADGSVQIFDVPNPWAIKSIIHKQNQSIESKPIDFTFDFGFNFDTSDCLFAQLTPIAFWKSKKYPLSLPMSLSWSQADPKNLFCAFHDGTVAMWKLSLNEYNSSNEMTLLLRFSADNEPLRSIACAPSSSSCGKNAKFLIATAGHSGKVKFWDVRDSFNPMWEFVASRGFILSLDWIASPNCICIAHDDGFVRVLSLHHFFPDHPQTKAFGLVRPSSGVAALSCRSLPICTINHSQVSNTVVYGSADGSLYAFKLTQTSKLHDSRYREAHFFCGGFAKPQSSPLQLLPCTKKPGLENTHASDFPSSFLPLTSKSLPSISNSHINPANEEGDITDDDDDDAILSLFPSEDVSILKVALNPDSMCSRWLAVGTYGGIFRCIFVPEIISKKKRKR